MANRPDQQRLDETPARRQPSPEQHIRPGLPLGLALVRVGLQQLLLLLHKVVGRRYDETHPIHHLV
jgi:hypothetical protein